MKYDSEMLRKKIAAMQGITAVNKDHDGYFQPSMNQGSGSAVLRFLPAMPDEDFPFVRIWNHAVKVDGKWFIDNCPSTLNQPCPVCESNTALWKSGNKDLASARKRKLYYHSNVLVVRDPKQAENDGKVMRFKYGKTIFDKIDAALNPVFPDTIIVNPFDVDEGANFRLRVTQNGNFPDYGKSSFEQPSPMGDPEQVEAILSQRTSLAGIVAPDQFKSYEELKAKFDPIIGAAKVA